MENNYSSTYPLQVVRVGTKRTFNYSIRETTEEEILELWNQSGRSEEEGDTPPQYFKDEHKYTYHSVTIPMGKWSYDGVVNAIIREKYREDQMEAITNNMNVIVGEFFNQLVTGGILQATKYLVGSINDANTANFKEMQEWRAMAKSEARGVFNIK